MGGIVLDTSVLIALFDPLDAHHTSASTAYRSRRQAAAHFVQSVIVLSECLVAVTRDGPDHLAARHRALVTGFGPARPVDEAVAVEAARLRAAHVRLRAPDALILATALVDEADEVLTCDRRWAAVHPRVVVLD